MSVAELSERTGYSRDNIHLYEECSNFCSLDFCVAVSNAICIDLKLICDEYTLFLNSNYRQKIEAVKKESKQSYTKIAYKYGIPTNTFLGWVKGDYVPCRASFEKHIKDNPLFYPL